MMLSNYGIKKELNERVDKIENQIGTLKDVVKTSLNDARNIITNALVGA